MVCPAALERSHWSSWGSCSSHCININRMGAVRSTQDSNPDTVYCNWKSQMIDDGSRVYSVISDVISRTRDAIILYFVLQDRRTCYRLYLAYLRTAQDIAVVCLPLWALWTIQQFYVRYFAIGEFFPMIINTLKPSGYYIYHRVEIKEFYVLPTQCIYVLCLALRTKSDYFPLTWPCKFCTKAIDTWILSNDWL
jgi:hypothetical protein